VRWHGTLTGDLLASATYQPDKDYRAQYDEGFQQGLEDAVILREL